MSSRPGPDRARSTCQQGRKEPVQTRIKNDRLGLGNAPLNPKAVTHAAEELVALRSGPRATTNARTAGAGKRRGANAAIPSAAAARAAESNEAYRQEQAWRRDMLRYMNT